MSHTGTLLIADITGYTMYLSQSELDHARETLQAWLEQAGQIEDAAVA